MNSEKCENGERKSRPDYMLGLLSGLLVRAQVYMSNRHLRNGLPQMAMFSFDYIGARINAFGRFERDELDTLIALLNHKRLLKGVCIDVGANIGNHSVFFADHFVEVHAFEPAPRPYALLVHNAGLRRNIHCHNVGLSDRSHLATLTSPLHNVGQGTLSDTIPENELHESASVQLVPLDAVNVFQGVDVGLIKIDVEGHELSVLDGGKALIIRTGPVIVFEQQAADITNGTSPVIDRLRALGYGDFCTISRRPETRFRLLTILLRLMVGERIEFKPACKFESTFHSMIVAIKSNEDEISRAGL